MSFPDLIMMFLLYKVVLVNYRKNRLTYYLQLSIVSSQVPSSSLIECTVTLWNCILVFDTQYFNLKHEFGIRCNAPVGKARNPISKIRRAMDLSQFTNFHIFIQIFIRGKIQTRRSAYNMNTYFRETGSSSSLSRQIMHRSRTHSLTNDRGIPTFVSWVVAELKNHTHAHTHIQEQKK